MAHEDSTIQPQSLRDAGPAPCVALTVLWHPDLERVGERAVCFDLGARAEFALSRSEPLFRNEAGALRTALDYPTLSRKPLRLEALADRRVRVSNPDELADARVGGEPVAGQVLDPEQLRDGVTLELGKSVVLLLHEHRVRLRPPPAFDFVGESHAMDALREQLVRVADMNVPVLLRGESGVGKELIAHGIHARSPRAKGPYLAVNMAAVPPSVAASELFGHARGAFTGASSAHEGYFARADGGTLFLDEIGETASDIQPLLLRAIEKGEVQTVGASRVRTVDVRLLAATDSDLERAIERGDFRMPLLQRLSGYEVRVPALRQRRDDLGRLAVHFLRRELQAAGEANRLQPPPAGQPSYLPAPIFARLARHPWPGNVRQLHNVIRQIVITNRDRTQFVLDPSVERLLDHADAPGAAGPTRGVASAAPDRPSQVPTAPGVAQQRDGDSPSLRAGSLDDEQLLEVLRAHRFNLKASAQALGVSRSWLNQRIDSCSRIRKAIDIPEAEIRACGERHGGDLEAMAAELEVSGRALLLQMRRLGMR